MGRGHSHGLVDVEVPAHVPEDDLGLGDLGGAAGDHVRGGVFLVAAVKERRHAEAGGLAHQDQGLLAIRWLTVSEGVQLESAEAELLDGLDEEHAGGLALARVHAGEADQAVRPALHRVRYVGDGVVVTEVADKATLSSTSSF